MVKISQDVVALYKNVLGEQDKAQTKKRASQIHLVQDRMQDEEEQNCPDHTQGSRPSPCEAPRFVNGAGTPEQMVLLVQRRSRAQIAGPGRYQFRPGMRKPKAIARGIRTTVPLKVRGRLGRVALVIPKPYIYTYSGDVMECNWI